MLITALLALKSLPEFFTWTTLLATAPTFFAVWVPVRAISVVLPRRTYGKMDDYLFGLYQKLVVFLFETLCPVEILFYGDVDDLIKRKESVLYISNHQSTMDWVVADMLAARQGSLGQMRYILKDGLRFLPLYGYYFHQHDCIYVRRARKFNSNIMNRNLANIPKSRSTTWLIIFPEGTRFKPDDIHAITSSHSFAQEKSLVPLKNVLPPRVKAFQLSLNTLRSYFDALYDITIIYSQTRKADIEGNPYRIIAPSMNEYVQGVGEQLHVFVNRVPIEAIPSDADDVNNWLYSTYETKDKMLEEYYSTGKITQDGRKIPLALSEILPAVMFFAGMNALLWSTSVGRKVYLASALGGSIFTVAWMGLRKVA